MSETPADQRPDGPEDVGAKNRAADAGRAGVTEVKLCEVKLTPLEDSAAPENSSKPTGRRRRPALDKRLAEAKDFALNALKELVDVQDIGGWRRATADDDRLVTHYFASNRRGYRDWEWYVTIARAPRQTTPTVCESGILPTEDALLAPEWVPWSQRLSEQERQGEQDAGDAAASDDEPGQA